MAALKGIDTYRLRFIAFSLSLLYGYCGVEALNHNSLFVRFYDTAWWQLPAFTVGCCAGLEVDAKAAALPLCEATRRVGDMLLIALFAVYMVSVLLVNSRPDELQHLTSYVGVPDPCCIFWGLYFMPMPLYIVLINVSFKSNSEIRKPQCTKRPCPYSPVAGLRSRYMLWLGEISMSLYMIHYEVFQYVQHFVSTLPLPVYMCMMLLSFMLALFLASLLTTRFENPAAQWVTSNVSKLLMPCPAWIEGGWV